MENFSYYIFCIIALVIAVFLLKKVAGCIIKSVVLAILLAVLAAVYYLYFKGA
ncbi:MAG: hypothetical protein SO294_03805 [Prevotella sp.]|nr:hypothetical protein [Prevotella sp.]